MKQSGDKVSAVAPTSDSQSSGPGELRKLAPGVWDSNIPRPWIESAMLAAADAWEKDKKVAQYAIADLGKMQARIEELERAIFDRVKRLEAAEEKLALVVVARDLAEYRLEVAEEKSRWLAVALSTFGPYAKMPPDEVPAEFAALAGRKP